MTASPGPDRGADGPPPDDHPEWPRAPSRRRLVAGIALVAAGVLLAGAAFAPWWTLTTQAGPESATLDFLPGADFTATAQNGTLSLHETGSYASEGLGALAGLYEAALYATLAAAALALLGGALALATESHRLRGGARGHGVTALGLVAFLLATAMVAGVVLEQPGQYAAADPGGECSGPSTNAVQSPCNSFWGSISGGNATATWGGALGWDLALAGAILAGVGGAMWWAGLENPWERDPEGLRLFSPARPGGAGPAATSPGIAPAVPRDAPIRPPWASAASASPTPPVGGTPRVPVSAPRPPAAAAGGPIPAALPPNAPSPPAEAGAPGVGTEVDRLAALFHQVQAGQLAREAYDRAKAALLAAPFDPGSARLPSSDAWTQEVASLDGLRDLGAVTGAEYLELRRRLILRQ